MDTLKRSESLTKPNPLDAFLTEAPTTVPSEPVAEQLEFRVTLADEPVRERSLTGLASRAVYPFVGLTAVAVFTVATLTWVSDRMVLPGASLVAEPDDTSSRTRIPETQNGVPSDKGLSDPVDTARLEAPLRAATENRPVALPAAMPPAVVRRADSTPQATRKPATPPPAAAANRPAVRESVPRTPAALPPAIRVDASPRPSAPPASARASEGSVVENAIARREDPPPVAPAFAATTGVRPPEVIAASRTDVPPAPTPAILPAASAPAAAGAPAAASVAPPAIRTAAPTAAIETVLDRYELAFSMLDARRAKAVWPTVNERNLARAFEGLEEQQFDLGKCDIRVTLPRATASCDGTARYTPKVGSRKMREERRRWTFRLQASGENWSIESVDSR